MTALTPGLLNLLDTVVERLHREDAKARENAINIIVDVDERLAQYSYDNPSSPLLEVADALDREVQQQGGGRKLTALAERLRSVAADQSLIFEDLEEIARTLRRNL